MRSSWLVQRLKRPLAKATVFGDNPFAFGGGKRNGGLSDEAMDALRGVWRFDYMGSAEFEWGAVPEALSGMVKDIDQLDTFAMEHTRGVFIYGICRREQMAEVISRISVWANESYNRNLKDPTHLARALDPKNEWDAETCGWLELDNGFLFFTDAEMFTNACGLFGIQTEAVSA